MQKIEEKFGCVTPFAVNMKNLCQNLSIEEYYDVLTKEEFTFRYPCKFLNNFLIVEKRKSTPGKLVVRMNTVVQKIESTFSYQFLDLFADLGGYLGIFLGTSLFQLRDALSYLIRKI